MKVHSFDFTPERYLINIFLDRVHKVFYGLLVAVGVWILIGFISWTMTPKSSVLSESQLKMLGARNISSFPGKSPLKPVRQFDSSRIQMSTDVRSIPQIDLRTFSTPQAVSMPGKQSETPSISAGSASIPSSSILQQWAPSSPQPSVSSTPQWQPYHSSPIALKESTLVPSYGCYYTIGYIIPDLILI